jgi:type VI secretion system protein ImpH
MATESRRAADVVAERLKREPWRFAFFQAVRLLEAEARRADDGAPTDPAAAVRFRTSLSRSFPAAEITGLVQTQDADEPACIEMTVAFIGLTGPLGVLPEHYLDLLYEQTRRRDTALRDFFDLFNHRTISLFYRAWEKFRPALGYERALREGGGTDPMSRLLSALTGLGTGGLADRQAFADQTVLGYAGHFARRPRSAWALRTLLSDRFGVPVAIEQMVGRWLSLEPEQCSRLPGAAAPAGQFNALGVDTVLGMRAWDEQGKFRLRIGPLDRAAFERFLPQSDDARNGFAALTGLARFYAGPDLDFDVRLVLQGDQVPRLTLGRSRDGGQPRLGWNTWLGHRLRHGNREEALFDAGPV